MLTLRYKDGREEDRLTVTVVPVRRRGMGWWCLFCSHNIYIFFNCEFS